MSNLCCEVFKGKGNLFKPFICSGKDCYIVVSVLKEPPFSFKLVAKFLPYVECYSVPYLHSSIDLSSSLTN